MCFQAPHSIQCPQLCVCGCEGVCARVLTLGCAPPSAPSYVCVCGCGQYGWVGASKPLLHLVPPAVCVNVEVSVHGCWPHPEPPAICVRVCAAGGGGGVWVGVYFQDPAPPIAPNCMCASSKPLLHPRPPAAFGCGYASMDVPFKPPSPSPAWRCAAGGGSVCVCQYDVFPSQTDSPRGAFHPSC